MGQGKILVCTSIKILLQVDHFMPAEDEKAISEKIGYCFTVHYKSYIYNTV